jgi:hypothetical protein
MYIIRNVNRKVYLGYLYSNINQLKYRQPDNIIITLDYKTCTTSVLFNLNKTEIETSFRLRVSCSLITN